MADSKQLKRDQKTRKRTAAAAVAAAAAATAAADEGEEEDDFAPQVDDEIMKLMGIGGFGGSKKNN